MNIYDIAKKAGVSPSTVSRVINNSENVSDKSRNKVRKVMEEEGYIPNIFARGLNLNSIKTVGILCPVIDDLNHARAVAIVEQLLRGHGFDSLLYSTGSNETDKSKYLESFLHRRVDAIVVIGSNQSELTDNETFRNVANHIPILIINGLIPVPNVYSVLCDEKTAVAELVQNLARQQHKNILYINDSSTYSAHQKKEGYLLGLELSELPFSEDLVLEIPSTGQETLLAYEAVQKLLQDNLSFSAVIGCDDTVAIGALKALRENQVILPVIGVNNSDFAFCSSPSLSSIDNQMEHLCRSAVDILMDVFKGEDTVSRIVINGRFVERKSYFWDGRELD